MTHQLRYFAFVARFVDSVSTEAMHAELSRLRQARARFERPSPAMEPASSAPATPVAA